MKYNFLTHNICSATCLIILTPVLRYPLVNRTWGTGKRSNTNTKVTTFIRVFDVDKYCQIHNFNFEGTHKVVDESISWWSCSKEVDIWY